MFILNNIFCKREKNLVEKCYFEFLQLSLMSGLIEDNWIVTYVSTFSLLWYHMSRSFWKTPLYICEKMSVKKAIMC